LHIAAFAHDHKIMSTEGPGKSFSEGIFEVQYRSRPPNDVGMPIGTVLDKIRLDVGYPRTRLNAA
jgi:hypothetical protein